MDYEIRTLQALGTQARLFFTQAVTGALVSVWANTFTVLGKVFALLDFEHELRRQWLFRQMFASTAAETWLIRHGFELGLAPDPGNMAAGTIIVPAPNGTVAPSGMTWVRGDGMTYSSLADATAVGNSVNIPVLADQAGALGNTLAGDSFTAILTDAVPEALGTTGEADGSGFSGGSDAEDVESFRARVLYRKRNPPQGGSVPDYVKWTGEALSTIGYDGDDIQVYVDSFQDDARSVWVCFKVSDQPNGIPTAGQIAIVQAYVNDPIRRPVTARVFATAPTEVGVPVAITNFWPDTPHTRAAVAAEIAALQADSMAPALPSTPFTLYREEVDAAIARAAGVGHFTLVNPAADQVFSTGGQMPVLGVPTYA